MADITLVVAVVMVVVVAIEVVAVVVIVIVFILFAVVGLWTTRTPGDLPSAHGLLKVSVAVHLSVPTAGLLDGVTALAHPSRSPL